MIPHCMILQSPTTVPTGSPAPRRRCHWWDFWMCWFNEEVKYYVPGETEGSFTEITEQEALAIKAARVRRDI